MSCLFGGCWPAEFPVDAERHPVLRADAPEVFTASLGALRKVAGAPCLHQIFLSLGVIDAVFNLSLSNITNKWQPHEDNLQTYSGMDQVNVMFSATGQPQSSNPPASCLAHARRLEVAGESLPGYKHVLNQPPVCKLLYFHLLRPRMLF